MRIQKRYITLLSILVLLAVWQMFAIAVDKPELIPSLLRLTEVLTELSVSEGFYQSVGATVARGLIGITLSLICALGAAWLFARYGLLYELFRPLLATMRSIPIISFILLALIFLNPESIPLMIAFFTMFPLLTENLTKGIKSLHPGLAIMGRQFHIGRYNTLSQIIYPQLKPFLYSGMASASGFGWRAIIMGEVLSQCTIGIGSEMKRAQNFIAVPELLIWTIVAILISILFDKGVNLISSIPCTICYAHEKNMIKTQNTIHIQAQKISYRYGVKNFSHSFVSGTIYGISAPSGTGKTTLLNLVGGILTPIEGKINTIQTTGISTVFQDPELLPHLTTLENILLPLSSLFTQKKAIEIATKTLLKLEIGTSANQYPHELSYGQQQRVAIARALAYPSPILLMDEPFKGLERDLSLRIIERIRDRQVKEKRLILFTSHSQDDFKLLADEIIHL